MAETSRYDLFLEISQNLNKTECRDLRTFVGSNRLLPGRDLQDMDPQQIFVKLEHKGKLKTGDLSLVVDLMTKIERDDFAKEAKRIAAQERKVLNLQNESDSSDEDLPDSPAKRPKLPHQSAGVCTSTEGAAAEPDGSGPETKSNKIRQKSVIPFRYIFYIKSEVSNKWKDLAGFLGFDPPIITNMAGRNSDDISRCGDMLDEWQRRKGGDATMGVLMEALTDADLGAVVKDLKKKYPELEEEPTPEARHIDKALREAADPPKPRLQTRNKKEAEPEADGDLAAPDDEGDGNIDVKVKACDEDLWEKIMNEKSPYRMNSKPRGCALILNNTNFTNLPYRRGAAVDLSNITALLKGLSFETHILEDKKAEVCVQELFS
ncbi:uncharacterized protein LOC118409152 [Branchiostoma floridae]|uniref:Uncharacterized protein LOC118409152 n=1 Tax=Branchiostoma floridae TaxID=7739 RepID=A0A9J7KJ65_BRAFL|nr:uncharacterized protein LOC118409152 [Branchiostoma floridae]